MNEQKKMNEKQYSDKKTDERKIKYMNEKQKDEHKKR